MASAANNPRPRKKPKFRVMDKSGQTDEERRQLRQEYQELLTDTSANKSAMRSDPHLFAANLERGEELTQKIAYPKEGTLDAKWGESMMEVSLDKARKLNHGFDKLTVEAFLKGVKNSFAEENGDVNWALMGLHLAPI